MNPLFPDQDWSTVIRALEKANGILLITHQNPDSDGIGSQIALYHLLRGMGKQVWIHNHDPVPRICRFLEGSEAASHGEQFADHAAVDLIVSVDCADLSRLAMADAFFAGRVLINIDHHASNTRFGTINQVDARYCATGAMIFDLILATDHSLSCPMARAIYAAVLTDTNRFQLSSVTPEVHVLAAELIRAGVDPEEASSAIYASNRLARLDLLKRSLKTLLLTHDDRVAWLHVTPEMYAKSGGDSEDTEGFIDYARSLIGIEVAVFIRPDDVTGGWKASFRSKAGHDVSALATSLGGGGHRYAAGCMLVGDLESVRRQISDEISKILFY